METFVLVLVLHVVLVTLFVAGRALHAKLGPMVAPTTSKHGVGMALASGQPDAFPGGRTLEEYAQAGLVDLRIMLVQAARRRHG